MPEKITPGPMSSNSCFREAVCVHTNKVYDSCKSKECIRDLRVYLTTEAQSFINSNTVSVKPRTAELLYVNIDVEKIPYNRGFYSIDARFFYRVSVEASTAIGCPRLLTGLAVYDKRCILFGSEGGAQIFSSRYMADAPDYQTLQSSNKPSAVIEAVEPILLEAKIVEPNYCCGCCCHINSVPAPIGRCFGGEELDLNESGNRLYITLGQFSIMRLERDIQLLMPAYDVCMPDRDCNCSGGGESEDPCDIFARFEFPVDAFFPPRQDTRRDRHHCGSCGNGGSDGGAGSTMTESNGSNASNNAGCNKPCRR